MSTTPNPDLTAFVKSIRHEADGIASVELLPPPGVAFPPFTPGSHIDLHLPNGMVRSYSLLNSAAEQGRYVIGVLNDRASRGGSKFVHEQLRVGSTLPISAPRNNFALHEDASHSVLVAGGIGVTPLLSMARRLSALGKPFEVLYFARNRASAAFVDTLQSFGQPVHLHFDDEMGGPPDLKALLSRRPTDDRSHYYACGPAPLLDAFERLCAEIGHAHAHIERFSAVEVAAAADAQASYTVELKRSARSFTITPAKSLLNTLLDAGVNADFSCGEGICGACETAVISGIPDHRDSVLSDKERASNKVMMICVSGCKTPTLVLDL